MNPFVCGRWVDAKGPLWYHTFAGEAGVMPLRSGESDWGVV